jgi:hypothetical protein
VGVILIKNKGQLYLTINGILFSLKWYITCEMVTRGYFFIDVLKMQILRIHPVLIVDFLTKNIKILISHFLFANREEV